MAHKPATEIAVERAGTAASAGAPFGSGSSAQDHERGRVLRFVVRVREGMNQTAHEVTASAEAVERLAAVGERPEDFVRRCFVFLLEREPKESILSRFDLSVIARYFPEFERAIHGG